MMSLLTVVNPSSSRRVGSKGQTSMTPSLHHGVGIQLLSSYLGNDGLKTAVIKHSVFILRFELIYIVALSGHFPLLFPLLKRAP